MTTNSEAEQLAYNSVAIDTAEKLHLARTGIQRKLASTTHTVEQAFPAHNPAGLGVALEYERMGLQPVSDDLQAQADVLGCKLEHLGVTLGTVIHGVNLKESPSTELIQFIRNVLLERKVIFFRDQNLSETEQVAFGRRFGELDAFPFGKHGENPYILEIAHDQNRPGTENSWHTDVTWMEKPSLGSIAQCIEVPPVGGDTLFSDSHACYLGLPRELQARVEHLHGIHDYRVFIARYGAGSLPDDLVSSIKESIPFGVSHPLLRTHPETGKTGLYIHGGFLRHDSLYDIRTGETLPPEESQAIVRQLLQQHARPEYICRFNWAPGSIAFWDNRAVQHYAASDYYPHRRVLRRVTVSGDKPFYDPES
jgi:taurine dioxygenase